MITSSYASGKCSTKFKMFCSFVYFNSISSPVFVICITSMPYLLVGTHFRSNTLFGSLFLTSHEVDAFTGIFMFEGDCVFPQVSSFSSFFTGPHLVSSFSSVAVELIPIIGGDLLFQGQMQSLRSYFPFSPIELFATLVAAHCHLNWLFLPVSLVFCSSSSPFFSFAHPW